MSRFSGKCDLYDHLMMTKMYDKGNCTVSDEWECFQIFKERTNGTLHQHKHLKVTENNAELIAKKNPEFKIITHQKEVIDRRKKTGKSVKNWDTYSYYGREYETLKELNAHGGVYITIDIHFDTLLDLIKYFPYIVTMCGSDEKGETVYISSESWVDSEYDHMLQYGYESNLKPWYNQELVEHYREVSLKYYNPQGHIQIETIQFDSDGIGYTSKNVNSNFAIEWVDKTTPHWSSPRLVENNKIKIASGDIKGDVTTVEISYVEDFEYPRDLK